MSRIPTIISRASGSDANITRASNTRASNTRASNTRASNTRASSILTSSVRGSHIRSRSQLGTRQYGTPKQHRSRSSSTGGNIKISSAVKHYSGTLLSNKNKAKDCRPLQDKQWQSEQLTKLLNYLRSSEDGLMLLNQGLTICPLTIKTFVNVCNFLLKKLVSRINITMVNYVEELQNILKKMQYPGMLSKALMITANVPRNWPSILAIMSWLVDIVINIEQEEIVDFSYDTIRWIKCITDSYSCWNNGLTYDDILENYIDDSRKNMYERMDKETVEMKFNSLKVDVARIEKEREHLKDEDRRYKQLSEYITQLKQQCIDLERVLEKCLIEDTKMDKDINDKKAQLLSIKEHVAQLKEQVKSQPLNLCEHETLKNKCKDLEGEIEIIENRIKCFDEYIWSTELTAEKKKKELTELIESITNKNLKFTMKFPEYKTLIVPEVNWKNSSDIGLLDSTKSDIQAIIKDIQAKISEKEDWMSKHEVRLGQLKYNIEEKESHLKKILEKIDIHKKETESLNEKYKNEIQRNVEQLETLKHQCAEIKNVEPSIEKATKELIDHEKKLKEWKDKQKELDFKAKVLFELLSNKVQMHCALLKDILDDTIINLRE